MTQSIQAQPTPHIEQQAQPAYNFTNYITQNLHYPEEAIEQHIEGLVLVKFAIEPDGNIANATITRGADIGFGIPEEALRIISNMPKWKPGKVNGSNIRSYFTVPISFKIPNLEGENSEKPVITETRRDINK